MRQIVHLDADAFFASVEQAADPRLRGKPVAVGGERRGIVASASYEARRFGIYTPMPTARARKLCPRLIVVPGDFEKYERFSRWMFSYAYDFTPEVEQTSIDEGYFDLTANHQKPPIEIAHTIRTAIRQALKISVSEGLGSNKLVSQIASKLHKPAAFHVVPPGGEIAFLHPLPNHWLPGVGPKTAERLTAAGLARIRHIAATPLELLELLVGRQARELRQFANGVDDRPLIPAREPQKSFSQQETFAQDQTDETYLEAVLRRMADTLFAKVRAEGKSIRTLTVKVRYNDMAEDQCSESLTEPTDLETDVYGRLGLMLRQAWKRRVSLRLISLKLSNVYDGVFGSELPLDGAAGQQAARERLARVVDELRRVKGTTVLLRGHDFMLRAKPEESPKSEVRSPNEIRNPKSETPETAAAQSNRRDSVATKHSRPDCCSARPASNPEQADQTGRPGLACGQRQPLEQGWLRPAAGALPGSTAPLPPSLPAFELPQAAAEATERGPSHRPSVSSYVPLRVRSHYSFLDSTLSPEAIVALAKEHGCSAVALTDFGNLHGAVEFTLAARQAGIKPILGAEIRVEGAPLLLYVESACGYANLCRLLSSPGCSGLSASKGNARIEGRDEGGEQDRTQGAGERLDGSVAEFHRRSFDRETVARFADGLLAASSDPRLAALFPGRFYRLATSRDTGSGYPVVACPAVCYAAPADRLKFDIVQSIRTRTLLRQAHPEKRLEGRFHFRTPAEMAAGCKDHPDWLARTREIAERCNFELPFGRPQFPAYRPPDGSTSREFLRRLALEGLRRRYAGRRIVSDTGAEVSLAQVRAQIETELAIIAEVGYEDLFLITWDLLQDCRARGIEWLTRGSAADSLVCYCLGISNVCPIRFGLYFRRFLNKERMALHKLPDIDVDFPHDRKDEVVALLFAKYGPAHGAVVGGFSTFQARSAVADVAKVLGVSEYQIRRFTEHFPWSFGGGGGPADEPGTRGPHLLELLRASPECRDLPLDEEPFRTAVETAAFLDGRPRHPKMHPCGVVLSRPPMHELTPTFVSNKGWPTTHFDMDAVEAIGLVKMDILAQGGLAVIRDAKAMLAARGIAVDLERFTVNERPSQNPKLETRSPKDARNSRSEVRSPKSETGSSESGESRPSTSAGTRGAGCSTCSPRGVVDSEAAGGSSSPLLHAANIADPQAGKPPDLAAPAGVETCAPADLAVRATNARLADEASSGFRISSFSPAPANLSAGTFDDPQVWELIAGGGARAVHHIESPAMTSLCRMCNVRDIDGLIAIVSVIRPGAANEQKKVRFTRRYQGLEPPAYPHPSLEACLRSTFGLVVYEEHILQICEAFAGLDPGRADLLRRALVKRNWHVVAELAAEFAAAARARGRAPEKIREVWELITGFNGYAFCKAHSTAYGVEAYQAAWLKCHFPAEFMAAVLTHGKGFYDPLVYVLECHRLGIPLLSPSVNEPGPGFTVVRRAKSETPSPKPETRNPKESRNSKFEVRSSKSEAPMSDGREWNAGTAVRSTGGETCGVADRQVGGLHDHPRPARVATCETAAPGDCAPLPGPPATAESSFRTSDFEFPSNFEFRNSDFLRPFIRVPLTRVKGLTERTVERLLAERARGRFASLADFYRRVAPQPEELEAMIRVGAFDEFGASRTAQFWEAQRLAKSEVRSPKSEIGHRNLEFDFEASENPVADFIGRNPTLAHEPTRRERLEAENALLGFPVSGHPLELYPDVAWETYCPVARLGEHVGETVVTCGLVVEQRVHHQVTGEPMKFLTLADRTGMVETELFAATYRSYGLATVRYPVLEVTARVEPFENGRGFSLRVLRADKPRLRQSTPRG